MQMTALIGSKTRMGKYLSTDGLSAHYNLDSLLYPIIISNNILNGVEKKIDLGYCTRIISFPSSGTYRSRKVEHFLMIVFL